MENKWEYIDIDQSARTPKTGTHTVAPEPQTVTKATAKISWDDVISISKQVEAQGYFAFHTYKDPLFEKELILDLEVDKSTDTHREWKFSHTNPGHSGWGYQEAEITLELIAEYNSDEGITSLAYTSSIRAYTKGSVHECYCEAKTETLVFLLNTKEK